MKKLLLSAMVLAAGFVANAQDIYIIGANVNGAEWALAQEDAKLTDNGDGTYTWDGEVLGSGFKLNDGTWKNDAYNFGNNGSSLAFDEPYVVAVGGSTGDIQFEVPSDKVINPHVTFNLNTLEVVVTGEIEAGEATYYLLGSFNEWAEGDTDYEFVEVDGKFVLTADIPTDPEFKVIMDAEGTVLWLGAVLGDDMQSDFNPAENQTLPYQIGGQDNNFNLIMWDGGEVTFVLDPAKKTLQVYEGEYDSVKKVGVQLPGVDAIYNLQGVKVANPVKGGIYIVNGKKVVL